MFLLIILAVAQPLPAQQGESPKALYDQAAKHYQNKNFEQALNRYRQFIADHPNHSLYWDAKFGVAQSLFKLNRFRESNRQFAAVRKNHPNKNVRGDALFGQIQISILEDNVAIARALSNKFLDLHPDHMLKSSVKRQLELMDEMDASSRGETEEQTKKQEKENEGRTPDQEMSEGTPADNPATEKTGDTSTRDGSQTSPAPTTPEENLPALRFDEPPSPAPDQQTEPREDTSAEKRDDTVDSTRLRGLSQQIDKQQQTIQEQQKTIQQLRSNLKQQRKQTEALRKTNRTLKQNIQRLKTQLSRKLSDIARDTELHELSRSMDLPDTARDVIESSLDNLRKQSRRAYDQGELERAKRLVERIITRSPRANDFYRASKIVRELGDHQQALGYIGRAIERSDSPMVKHLAEKADLLLEHNTLDQLKQLENEYGPIVSRQDDGPAVAHWYHVIGQRYLRQDRPDEAFFHLMQSVRSAPKSRWSNRSRSLIQDKL